MSAVSEAEYSISRLARLAGTTSRTLRHYDDVGLLPPSRVGANGYRYYDRAALVRLQRILMLRELGLSIPSIVQALAAADEVPALRLHLQWLRSEATRLERQITSVERTIDSLTKGTTMTADEMFDGFDHTQYRTEVERRWGAQAFSDADEWWRSLGAQGQREFGEEHREIAAQWEQLAAAGIPADRPQTQEVARRHLAWITRGWGGKAPNAQQLVGLADMYVADERFAANYGGVEGASYVRDALIHLALTELV